MALASTQPRLRAVKLEAAEPEDIEAVVGEEEMPILDFATCPRCNTLSLYAATPGQHETTCSSCAARLLVTISEGEAHQAAVLVPVLTPFKPRS